MASFDWLQFLQARRIEYFELAKRELEIYCPFCGSDGPDDHHLAINLDGHGWHCWRNKTYKGRSPVGLIQVLLKCTWEQAREYAGLEKVNLSEDTLSQAMALLEPLPAPKCKPLKLPNEFMDFTNIRHARPFLSYLRDRGFSQLDAERHGLLYCMTGPFRGRIIFPVQMGGHFVSWTGRTILPDREPRYLSHTVDPERARDYGYEPAAGPINSYFLWYDSIALGRADTLVVCEGPMDAFKVSVLGARSGIFSTCLFGAEPTPAQIELLYAIASRFKRKYVLLDSDAAGRTMRVVSSLRNLGFEARFMIPGRKDPGDLRDRSELAGCLAR